MRFDEISAIWLIAVLYTLCANALDEFQYCLRATPRPALLECVGRQALTSLSTIQESDNFTIDSGFVLVRDDTHAAASRALPNFLDQDPTDFRWGRFRKWNILSIIN